jgi:replicative DNA helicase
MVDEQYLMTCLLKGMMEDKNYALTVATAFDERYFDTAVMAEIYKFISGHVAEHDALPNKDIVINSVPKDLKDDVIIQFQESEATDFSVSQNYDWLLENTNEYLKDRAIKRAIVDSVDLVKDDGNIQEIRNIIENALCKDLRVDLGLDYFEQLAERLKRVFETTENRVKTYYPMLDELFNGGYPAYTLNMFIAKIHGHKTNIMTNIIARQIRNGVKCGMATLEMSEDMYAQRFDANLTNVDINRMYINKTLRGKFLKDIKEIKDGRGDAALYLKEYPTGKASVADFRIWLRELAMRDKLPDIFYCDYISLMKAEYGSKGDMYQDGKSISEELRALGWEFHIPVVTVAQINRTSTFLDFDSLDMNSIGESFGIPATADSMIVQGGDEDDMVYQNELKWKNVKNRLGGRVGHIGKWYFDARSLRMYDETELDLWIEEASQSGDDRLVYEGSE